jgi:hypothetical protein
MDNKTESAVIETKKRNFIIVAVVLGVAILSFKLYADTQMAKG